MYIDKEIFKNTNNNIGLPASNKVYYGYIDGVSYVYKDFNDKESFNNEIDIKRFEELCKRCNDSNLILPKYLVKNETLEGYISKYYHGLPFDRIYMKSYKTRLQYLLKIKDVINESLNKGIVHSDVHFGNILFNEKEESVALIDFDNAKIDDITPIGSIYSEIVKDYILYNDHDKYLDIFMFNLLTFATLHGTDMNFVLRSKGNFNSNFFTSNSAKKLLTNLSLYKKTEEFLVDMVDESSFIKKIPFNYF